MPSRNRSQYTYEDAGFNGFFRRSISSAPTSNTLRNSSANKVSRDLNFDSFQTSGGLGDKIKVGTIILNGVDGRIEIRDNAGNEVTRLGELGDV